MRNRRAESELSSPSSEPGFRLRYVLFALVVGGIGLMGYPRLKAAWRLADKATALANYSLCMAGPTGPSVLTENPTEFHGLLRRRLLSAEETDQPFANCRTLYEQFFDQPGQALLSAAGDFAPYSGRPSTVAPSLEQLIPRVDELRELAQDAWPFSRKSHLELIRPSVHAKEAPHPVDFPQPVVGSGLPSEDGLYRTAWRHGGSLYLAVGQGSNLAMLASNDGGQTWAKGTLTAPGVGEHAGRCAPSDAQQSFLLESEDSKIAVVSMAGDDPVGKTVLRIRAEPHQSSCDNNTALFVAHTGEGEPPFIVLCQHSGRCGKLQVPTSWTTGSFDVAQVDGVSVVATLSAGVVRVRSSRDRGKTWTPATIAMDTVNTAVAPSEHRSVHLQPTGSHLLLWTSGQGSAKGYPLVVSEDYGASFRGANTPPPKPAPRTLVRR